VEEPSLTPGIVPKLGGVTVAQQAVPA